MITAIGQIAAAIGAIVGLLVLLYKVYWCPAAKARRQAAKDGQEAVEAEDIAKITGSFDQLNRK